MSKIFLSHTRIDKPFVRKLAADLRKYGHTVWIDEAEIKIGESLIGKIREGLDSVDYVAAVLSRASIQSEWVKKELEIASNKEIKEKRVIVLPLILEHVELPGFLEGKLYGDFSDENNYDSTLSLLLRSLGDNNLIEKSDSELKAIRKELDEAKEIINKHKKTLSKVIQYNLSTKSEKLQERIREENKRHPEYAPINNVYSFELGDIPITLGYLLWVIGKIKRNGAHQIEPLLEIHDKWNEANRMIEAYSEMLSV
ncbi:MAG: toll/interleukin-1 receptor domain-containing protein [Flavisolibacter sp.]